MSRVLTKPLFLLGMMGAGKSSVGRELARREGAVFIDLDERIERMFAASISELFELGEDYFRACEHTALISLIREPGFAFGPAVVATGGGVVTQTQNLRAMASIGELVYLEVDVETLAARLSSPAQRELRPLLARESADGLRARLAALLDERRAAYLEAGRVVDAGGSPAEVAASIVAAVT